MEIGDRYDQKRGGDVERKPRDWRRRGYDHQRRDVECPVFFWIEHWQRACTSPSEMLAAAVAACVSLMVAQEMAKNHLKYDHVKTEAVLTLQEKAGHWDVTEIVLHISSPLPDRDAEKFQKCAKAAKSRCPISRALKVPIKLVAKLEVEQPAFA